MNTGTANYATKTYQKTDENGRTTTVSVWIDKKIRTGYYVNDMWDTLYRSTVPNLTDQEWFASPGHDWKDITLQG